MKLKEKLVELKASGELVGICPWKDGDGELWGRITEIKDKSFVFQNVSPFGQDEDVDEYRFKEIAYLDINKGYAERLKLLRDFTPVKPEGYIYHFKRSVIKKVLKTCIESGEIAHVHLTGFSEPQAVKVLSVDGKWVEIVRYDGSMREAIVGIFKMSSIEAIKCGTSSEEAEEYLLNLQSKSTRK